MIYHLTSSVLDWPKYATVLSPRRDVGIEQAKHVCKVYAGWYSVARTPIIKRRKTKAVVCHLHLLMMYAYIVLEFLNLLQNILLNVIIIFSTLLLYAFVLNNYGHYGFLIFVLPRIRTVTYVLAL